MADCENVRVVSIRVRGARGMCSAPWLVPVMGGVRAGTALTLSESETTLPRSESGRLRHLCLEEVAVAAGFEGSAIEVGEVSYGKRTRVEIGGPLARGFLGHGLDGGFLNAAIGE